MLVFIFQLIIYLLSFTLILAFISKCFNFSDLKRKNLEILKFDSSVIAAFIILQELVVSLLIVLFPSYTIVWLYYILLIFMYTSVILFHYRTNSTVNCDCIMLEKFHEEIGKSGISKIRFLLRNLFLILCALIMYVIALTGNFIQNDNTDRAYDSLLWLMLCLVASIYLVFNKLDVLKGKISEIEKYLIKLGYKRESGSLINHNLPDIIIQGADLKEYNLNNEIRKSKKNKLVLLLSSTPCSACHTLVEDMKSIIELLEKNSIEIIALVWGGRPNEDVQSVFPEYFVFKDKVFLDELVVLGFPTALSIDSEGKINSDILFGKPEIHNLINHLLNRKGTVYSRKEIV